MPVIDKEKCIGQACASICPLVQFQKQMTAHIISTPMNGVLFLHEYLCSEAI